MTLGGRLAASMGQLATSARPYERNYYYYYLRKRWNAGVRVRRASNVTVSRGQVQKIFLPLSTANCQLPTAKPTIHLARTHPREVCICSQCGSQLANTISHAVPIQQANELYSDIEQVELCNDGMKIISKYPNGLRARRRPSTKVRSTPQ